MCFLVFVVEIVYYSVIIHEYLFKGLLFKIVNSNFSYDDKYFIIQKWKTLLSCYSFLFLCTFEIAELFGSLRHIGISGYHDVERVLQAIR